MVHFLVCVAYFVAAWIFICHHQEWLRKLSQRGK
jgi:hypothetical protein